MGDIFTEDRVKAQLLAWSLEAQGWSVWWNPKNPLGNTYDEVLEKA